MAIENSKETYLEKQNGYKWDWDRAFFQGYELIAPMRRVAWLY